MKPLETEYNGLRFRSRAKARWAVFMDAMSVTYEYEPEAYDIDGSRHVPDFWVPSIDAHLEVKQVKATKQDDDLAAALAKHTQRPVYIMIGSPILPDWANAEISFKVEWDAHDKDGEHMWSDNDYWWCECPNCKRVGLQFNGRADRIPCPCPKSAHGDKGYNYDSDRLMYAYSVSRGYRFGPGEANPKVKYMAFV